MKATEQYFPVGLYRVVLTSSIYSIVSNPEDEFLFKVENQTTY